MIPHALEPATHSPRIALARTLNGHLIGGLSSGAIWTPEGRMVHISTLGVVRVGGTVLGRMSDGVDALAGAYRAVVR